MKYNCITDLRTSKWSTPPGYINHGVLISDYSTLMTGGLTGDLAVTYLGSYALNWTSRIEGDYAIINFEINNSSTMESGTRPPIIGYTNLWKSSIGKLISWTEIA